MTMTTKFNFSNPESKKEITKDFMKAFIKTKSQDEIKWYIDLCKSNTVIRTCGLDDKEYNQPDFKKIRKAFVNRYFPELNKKKSAYVSYLDELESLIA